jgi:hypothetical protein
MKIANIIYEKELINHSLVDYINYIKEPTEYEKIDKTLPTLYVGWSFMKLSNPNNPFILNHNILSKEIIKNQLYWECSFNESKTVHVGGIEKFTNNIPDMYFKARYEYINIDPINFNIKTIGDFANKTPQTIDVIYNLKNDIIYILSGNKIYGIDLILYKYFLFNVNEIKTFLYGKTTNIIEDIDGEVYRQNYNIFPNFSHLKRYLIIIVKK